MFQPALCLQVVGLTSDGVLTVKVGARAMQTRATDVAPTAESKASRAAAATFGKAASHKSRAGRQGQSWEATSVVRVYVSRLDISHAQALYLCCRALKQGCGRLVIHIAVQHSQPLIPNSRCPDVPHVSCIILWCKCVLRYHAILCCKDCTAVSRSSNSEIIEVDALRMTHMVLACCCLNRRILFLTEFMQG